MSQAPIVVSIDNRKFATEPNISAAIVLKLLDAGIPVKAHTCGQGITVEHGTLKRFHDCSTQTSIYEWISGGG